MIWYFLIYVLLRSGVPDSIPPQVFATVEACGEAGRAFSEEVKIAAGVQGAWICLEIDFDKADPLPRAPGKGA